MIHADDAGLSTAENSATIAALKYGLVTSYSIMVPCAWFYEMADFALHNPQFDYGIHLTLTCEWKKYRFGPIAPLDQVKSLVDQNGYFHKTRDEFKDNAKVAEVEKELSAQIDKALKLGLQPSHLDCHMYSLGVSSEMLEVYKKMGDKYNLPVQLNTGLIKSIGSDAWRSITKDDFEVDRIFVGAYAHFGKGDLENYYQSVLEELEPGINVLLIHPAFDTEEMKSITESHPNFGAEWRQIDYTYFTSQKCKETIEANKIQLVSWKDIKEIMENKKIEV